MSSTSPSPTTLLSLPPELLLMIADYHLDDYLFWECGRFKYLRKITYETHGCSYVSFAKTNVYLWGLMMERKFQRRVGEEEVVDWGVWEGFG